VRIVEAQKEDIAVQMQALDAFVTRARSQNGAHHESSIKTLSTLAAKVGDAHSEVRRYLDELRDQTNDFESRSTEQNGMLKDSVEGLTVNLRKPLSELRSVVQQTTMADYIPTGTTPQKRAYDHPTVLPRTEPHENILSRLRDPESPSHSSNRSTPVSVQSPASLADSRSPSPSRGSVFNDGEDEEGAYRPPPEQSPVRPGPAVVTGLRELDVNVVPRPQTTATAFGPGISDSVKLGGVPGANDDGLMNNKDLAGHHGEMLPPPAKRHFSSRMSANMLGVGQQKVVERTNVRRLTRNIGVVGEGRENVPLPAARQLGGRRRLRSSNVP
jgi:kinesin family protein 11